MESKMVAAKRQRKGESLQKGNKGKIRGPQSRKLRWNKHHPLPDLWWVLFLICIRPAGGVERETKSIKRGSQDVLRPLLQGRPPSHLWGVLSFIYQIKLWAVTLVEVSSICCRDWIKEISHSPDKMTMCSTGSLKK